MQDGTFSSPGHLQETAHVAPAGDVFASDCPTRQLLNRIGDKWSVLVLLSLADQDLRFNDLKRRIGGISQKVLTQTVRSLERDGLIDRTVEATIPVSVTYSMTKLGARLVAALRLMVDWAETHMGEVLIAQKHYDARVT